MQLPIQLQNAIEELLEHVSRKELIQACEELSERYRLPKEKANSRYLTSEAQRSAYIAARLPATYAAVFSVLSEVRRLLPNLSPRSLLDLGAGPGTAMWAASELFPGIQAYTLMENDNAMMGMGKRFAQKSEQTALQQANWQLVHLEQAKALPSHDLLILSYSIGELSESARNNLLSLCWEATQKLLIIIEPGTPVGFERIRSLRSQLIAKGGYLLAPCPHMGECPMANGNWCHFSQRIERTSLHRQVKGASLGHEDEKFSYLVFSKEPPPQAPKSRVLRHPQKRSGHILLSLCTPEGLKEETVSKRTEEEYKIAKRLEWGDTFSRTH